MKKYLFLILPLALLCTSCSEKKYIPKEDMAAIVYDCILTDKYLETEMPYRAQADTTLVYLPVLEKHGYTQDQFLESLKYWLSQPKEMKEIYNLARTQMKERRELLQQELDENEEGAAMEKMKEMKASESDREAELEQERMLQEEKMLEQKALMKEKKKLREKRIRDKKNKRDIIINEEGAPIVETPSN